MNFTATELSELNEITARKTFFKDFNSLVDSYYFFQPSFIMNDSEETKLANAYDKEQKARGCDSRAKRVYILKK